MEARTLWRCTIEVNGEVLHYEKYPTAATVNIYNESGDEINCFTHYDLDTIEAFEAACIADAKDELGNEDEEEEPEEEDDEDEDEPEDMDDIERNEDEEADQRLMGNSSSDYRQRPEY